MTYLQRIDQRPSPSDLSANEESQLTRVFDAYGAEIIVNGRAIRWEHIDEVEVVIAPHIGGASGWFVKKFIFRNEERYHVGIYYGSHEAILPNITWDMAKHVLRTIAFYAPQPIKYSGPEDLTPLTEI